MRFKLHGGASDQNAGILFGLQRDGSYHYLRYNTKDGDLALQAFANGERRNIAHGDTKLQLPLGTWQTLELRIDGTTLTARVPAATALPFLAHPRFGANRARWCVGQAGRRHVVSAIRSGTRSRAMICDGALLT